MKNPLDALNVERLNERLGMYRPAIDRSIAGLALAGVVVVVHLGLQQARGFEQGCFGFGSSAAASAFDCATVVASAAGTLFGISNITLGAAFYGVVAILSYVALLASGWRLLAKQIRAGLIGLGFVYSAYLVYYQVSTLDALCALCLVSAGIVAALFVLQAVSLVPSNRSTQATMSSRSSKREFTLLTYLIVLSGLVVSLDVLYFSGASAASAPAAAALSPAGDTTEVAEGCFYDAEKDPVENFATLVDFQDPSQGNAGSPVTIVEYFDPNCPHCKTMHTVMKQAMEQYGDEAQFVFKAMPLWGYSVAQIEALHAAAQEGKFFGMLEAQFERQQPGGLSMEQLQDIAQEIGMNPDVLTSRLEEETYRNHVLQQRERAVEIGVDSTPTLIINGRFIDGRSRTLRCFGEFIEAARQEASPEQEAAVDTTG